VSAPERARHASPEGHYRETRILRAVAYIVVATVLFVIMNAGVKVLRASIPTVELIWVRSLGHLIFVVALFAPAAGGWRLFATRKPGLQVARSVMLLASTSFFFTAIGLVPLADATAISFTSPFIVAALAGRFLGERVGADHWIAIGLGFVGALVVIRPGAGTSPYAVLVLGSAACYAAYQLLTRRVAGFDRPETSVAYSALVGTGLLSLVVPFYWVTPERLWHWGVLAMLGLFGGLGHYYVARALMWGPASIISPFHYVQLVWAAVVGYLVFGDVPPVWTWLGSAVIIGSGLYIALRELQQRP
jgi:drug/metabolite transporter (DMT)-like permease